jgi:hypothetical protein
MKGDKNACKYNKVTQQKKFHLLTLVIKDKLLIKEVSCVEHRPPGGLASTIPLPKPSFSSTATKLRPTSLIFRPLRAIVLTPANELLP